MYVNDRDQINYHGFLSALRTMRGYSLHQVSAGVCCESGMNRFENGNRVAEKLVRDRLTARLGVSCEKYEDYLQPKEYVRWEQRLRIIKAIQKKDLKAAKRELSTYEEFRKLNCVNQQFVEVMRYMLLELEGASRDELHDCIQKAVKFTIPNIAKHFEKGYLLSDQEVNLLLELMSLEEPKKVIKDLHTWRISEYEKLISYIDSSCWEKLQKAKVYSRVTYFICKELLSNELTESEIRRGLELCHNAIELLRDTSRLYYFIELTEARRVLAERLMGFDISIDEKSQLDEMLSENNQWEKVFKDLYAEFKVTPYMSDFCYLYYENECHNMVAVIETRRNMLDISRAKLSAGICTERTIIRMEREGANPTIELARRLFDKMGMCAEYRRAIVVSTDVNALTLMNEVAKNINSLDFINWENNILKLKDKLNMNISFNKQELSRIQTLLRYRKKELEREELYTCTKKALGYTLPLEALKRNNYIYLTRNELAFVFDLAFKMKKEESSYCIKIIEEICKNILEDKEIKISLIAKYELLTGEFVSYLGNIGEYKISNKISEVMLKECLAYRKISVVPDYLYSILWNHQQEDVDSLLDNTYTKSILNKCLHASSFIKRKDRIAFFQNKLEVV